jgi:hypothetical protein
MHLNFEGKTTDAPTSADIARAVPRGRVPEEWTIELVGDEGISIEADPGPENGLFKVAYVEGRRIYDADGPMTAEQLERLLIAFLKRDESWRKLATWTIWTPAPQTAVRSSAWFPAIVILLIFLAVFGTALWFFQLL